MSLTYGSILGAPRNRSSVLVNWTNRSTSLLPGQHVFSDGKPVLRATPSQQPPSCQERLPWPSRWGCGTCFWCRLPLENGGKWCSHPRGPHPSCDTEQLLALEDMGDTPHSPAPPPPPPTLESLVRARISVQTH